MPIESNNPLLTFIRRLAVLPHHSELTDGELLRRFVIEREKSAFTALMHRHGPMVLGVCRCILQDEHDAEDAFQATFLVFIRKAKCIGKPASVASWLHGVAYRLAMKARTQSARRRASEKKAVPMSSSDPQDEVMWRDLRPVLHEEITLLPERYRLPFVLCYLEGKTNEEAAVLLGWPKGTVLSSLSRARSRLRTRLTRRGVALSSGLTAALLSPSAAPAALPAALAESTLHAASLFTTGFTTGGGASGAIAAPVIAYSESMLATASLGKLKIMVAAFLLVGLLGTGTGAFLCSFRLTSVEESLPAEVRSWNPPQAKEAAGQENRQPPSREMPKLQGSWIIESAQLDGQAVEGLTGRCLQFKDSRFILSAGGEGVGGIPGSQWEGGFSTQKSVCGMQVELKPDPNFTRTDLIQETGPKHLELHQVIRQPSAPLLGSYSPEGETLTMHLTITNDKQSGTELFLMLKRK